MKVICGLGNPGPEYAATRHNVGWWVVDRAASSWGFPAFRRDGAAWAAAGRLGERTVRLMKPRTYMNRSGAALGYLRNEPDFDVARDLLLVVDDAALDLGRVRYRERGSAGGHNGLRSVEAVLGTREYDRLRIGVGGAPSGVDLSDWVLSPFEPDEAERILERMPDLVAGLEAWVREGPEPARRLWNR